MNSTDLTLPEQAVLVKSEELDDRTPRIKGYDFNKGLNYEELLDSYLTTGFQATNLSLAIDVNFYFWQDSLEKAVF